MVSDKFKKTPLRILNKLISHVHFLEPRENTKQRVISSLIMIPLALYAIFHSENFFIFLSIAIAMMMMVEWLDMIRREENQTKWRTIGLFYILIPVYSIIKIRMIDSNILFWMFAIIWATDIFAFFAGRSLGGPKIAPDISPNKTWSGLAGGVIASMLIGLLSSFMFANGGILFFVTMSMFLSLLEQGSDLLESKFKRMFGVKDSGSLIPGHGGVLDRLDGMMLVAPVVLFLITVFPTRFGM